MQQETGETTATARKRGGRAPPTAVMAPAPRSPTDADIKAKPEPVAATTEPKRSEWKEDEALMKRL